VRRITRAGTATAAAALLLLTAACGSDDDSSGKAVPKDTPKATASKPAASKAAEVAAPPYKVIKESLKANGGSVDLLIPTVTVDQAQAAIRAYAKTIDGPKDVSISVVRSADAGTYVCLGRWIRDAKAAELYTGGRVKADKWPAIDMNCPDPGGAKP